MERSDHRLAERHFARAAGSATLDRFVPYQALGLSRISQQAWNSAIEPLEESLVSYPANADVHRHLGYALFRIGRTDSGISHLQRAVGLNRVVPSFRLTLGQALGEVGRPEEAIAELNQGVLLQPEDRTPYYLALGVNHRRAGDLRASARALGRARGIAPDDQEVLNSLAVTRILQADFAEARNLLGTLVNRHPSRADYRTNLAIALINLSDRASAEAHARQVLILEPGNRVARALLDSLSRME